MYFNYHIFIKYACFEPIYYAINLHAMSSSKVFNEFDCVFLLNILLV